MSDGEYDEHYEALVSAIKGLPEQGVVVDLPTVRHQFLREVPLVEGEWIDRYTVELAEWGARLIANGFLLEDSDDNHPVAWQRIIDPESGSEVDSAVTVKLWQRTRKHIAGFLGRTRDIDGRLNLNFADYLKCRSRRAKGDLKSGMGTGLGLHSWNQWVEEHGGEGKASLAGVRVSELSCYLDGYRCRVCRNAGELNEELTQCESMLESLQVGKPDNGDDEQFRQRVEHWKELALGFLPEIYTLRRAIDSIGQRYFDGQQTLFSTVAEGFDQLLALVDKTVGIYNEHLAGDIDRLESLSNETKDGEQESTLTIDLAGLIENVQGAAGEQVGYMGDMAKAEASAILGNTRQAFELVDRHV